MVSTLNWDWKVEPVSPQTLYEDTVQFDDSSTASSLTAFKLQSSIIKDEEEVAVVGNLENKAEVFSKLLEQIEDLDNFEELLKEENFSNWLGEKADLPIFEDIPIEPARCYPVQQSFKSEDLKPLTQEPYVITPQEQATQDTNTLLQEFETVFDAVEMTHGTLTPPQSPPSADNQRIVTTLVSMPVIFAEPIGQPVYYQERIAVPLPVDLQPGTPQPDVAHELAVVDELVRSRAENMVDDDWEEEKKQELIVSPFSPSSSSCSTFSEYSSDPEWIPETVQSTSNEFVERPTKGRKRAGKPYLRIGPEDKKSRKKEQNKNAATRYRQKKKAEIEEILSEEKGLMDHHDELDTKVTDLKREIKYLKGLMRDLFKAKGLIQ